MIDWSDPLLPRSLDGNNGWVISVQYQWGYNPSVISRVSRWIEEPTLCVPITKRCVTHVGELDVALRARVHEKVTVDGVELGGSDDFSQLLHVHRFDVDNV